MAVTSTIPRGTVLSGKYRVERELGRGGMAAVYEATNVDIDKRVAIKLLAGHLAASQTVVERFLREARAVSQIRSPHICEVYDSGRLEDGTPFLVLELLEGESLYDAMCRDRQMSPQVTLAIILQVAKGLDRAHDMNIVHRDLKPENIFLTVDLDGHLLVKVLDFGLAKFYDPVNPQGRGKGARLTREGAVFGTPAYMSPEQVRGQAAADTRADLWALACITYECFTGTTVWSTEDGVAMTFAQIATAPLPDPRKWRPDLPESFTLWFFRALDRDITQRFQNVDAFADELVAAFDYRASAGGLDPGLISRITHQAALAPDSETITERARRKLAERQAREREAKLHPIQTPPPPPPSFRSPPSSRAQQPFVPAPPQSSASPHSVERFAPHGLEQQQMAVVPTVAPPPPRSKLGIVLTIIVLLGLSGAAVVFGVERPSYPEEVQRFAPYARRLLQTEPYETTGFKDVAKHPWLPLVREAQALIAIGEHDRALNILRRVHEQHRHGLIRNLMDQVQVAVVARSSAAGCQVTGLARPRAYDLLSQDRQPVDASPPSIVLGLKSAVMTWSDPHDGQRRGYAVPLDESLRNRKLPIDLTPEGTHVMTPTLVPQAGRFLAAYWDATGDSLGVYMRWLAEDGVIAGAPISVIDKKPGAFQATAARHGEGFVVAWIDQIDGDSADIFYRLYSKDGKPQGEAVRVTDYAGNVRQPTKAAELQVSASDGHIVLAYGVIKASVEQIRVMVVPAKTKAPGLEGKPDDVGKERTLEDETELSSRNGKSSNPSLACVKDGCFVAWHENDAASVAFIDSTNGSRQWHKRFASAGKKPAIGISPSGELRIAWYEAGRLTTATLGREGVGPSSKVARVVGDQPPPVVAGGAQQGEWYIAWLDYESGHREPYALRILCE